MLNQVVSKGFWFAVALVWLVVDLWSKQWAVDTLKETGLGNIDVLPVLRWLYAENHGAAFSLLSGQRWLLLLIGVVATVMLLVLIVKTPKKEYLTLFAYASILGGAVGNIYDRYTLGYVRDMISVYYEPINFYFAIFNVADMAISIGVGAMLLSWLLERRR
ncbi:signal peptidase II [Ostreibacterium oceani]|uniref:Lipoprotein signal peptidase n=1 Tax=Ostreibacterium oceani TaxID=2654998 RepID=A0A6N7F3Q4_9GAMM|nr:signal peptidase II [Ostreibacterium oceani]MPV86506.1 signal peptidase II [Ostreibacterium oceani]